MTSILAAFALLPDPTENTGCADLICSDLEALERRFVARRPRRAGRMTRMACVGASGCLAGYDHGETFGKRLGVFHGTALGNLQETCDVVRQVVEEPDQLPSPIRFSCSMSNMSSFFVAQVTGARGPNLLVSQGVLSFEGALLAAVLAQEVGECEHVLVGATDGSLSSREEYVTTLGCPAATCLGEGSGWLLLGPESPGACGDLLHVELLPGGCGDETAWAVEVAGRCRDLAHREEPIRIMPGTGITQEDSRALLALLPGARLQPYLDETGLYPTASAAGLAARLAHPRRAATYAHVARNDERQSSLTLIRVRP